jgi:hypothetical protein
MSSTLRYKVSTKPQDESRTPQHEAALPPSLFLIFRFSRIVGLGISIVVLGNDKSMPHLAKFLIVTGAMLLVAGLALMLLGRTSLPLGRLPGDIVYPGKNTTFYFPLATSLLVSIVLSLALYVLSRFGR